MMFRLYPRNKIPWYLRMYHGSTMVLVWYFRMYHGNSIVPGGTTMVLVWYLRMYHGSCMVPGSTTMVLLSFLRMYHIKDTMVATWYHNRVSLLFSAMVIIVMRNN